MSGTDEITNCPCKDDTLDPCPACGATVSGDDPVLGICQAKNGYPPKHNVLAELAKHWIGNEQ